MQAIAGEVERANESAIPPDHVVLLGFSHGGCLSSEFVARNPTRYGGLAVLSGSLIGETVAPENYDGDLESTPIFLGCSDVDPHVPEQRVHRSAAIFEQLNGDVTKRLYEGMGHGINGTEIDHVSGMIAPLVE